MCTTCYDNFLYRCHNNKLTDLSGILIWAPLGIFYIYKHCRKQTVACRSHIPDGTLTNCKCRTSFEWSKIHKLLVTGEKNQCLKLVYLLLFFLEILKCSDQKKYWNLSRSSFEVLYPSWITWCCQELDAVVLCRKRFTLLLVSSSDPDLLCFGADENSFTKLCSLSSTP